MLGAIHTNEVGYVVVVVISIDVVDMPTVWNCVAGIKPDLSMQACKSALAEMLAVRIVIKPSLIAFIMTPRYSMTLTI
jgi:hypothetical protein